MDTFGTSQFVLRELVLPPERLVYTIQKGPPNGVIVGYEVIVRNLINSDENISKNVNNTNISDGIGNNEVRSGGNID